MAKQRRPRPKAYPDEFTQERRLAWVRSRNQARFRDEEWNLSFEEFCSIWSDPAAWSRRGRKGDDLVLTRRNHRGPWNTANVKIISRLNQIRITHAITAGRDYGEYFEESIQ